ncbi:MAG: sulfurtransferase [SAR86 cluster bacterium]|uniref:Sulfurtransferase n=1 Tax=SAR86 cluster bacterium TaxID=2030880 RepID=A0A2A4MPN3_9GAMM|nr:MAG: sulfurtransferase [SAR86 cluster bacterium]
MLSLDSSLVDVAWLNANLACEQLIILDASVIPVVPGYVSINSGEDFRSIPGGRRFDYDAKICDSNAVLPHMMPGVAFFQQQVRELGINNNSVIVIYDDVGIYASPRAWWMLKSMGHAQVAVLDGGLPSWCEAGFAVDSTLCQRGWEEGDFLADYDSELFSDATAVMAALDNTQCRVMDARSAARFAALAPEPRPGVRGGHMPNAINLPFGELLSAGKMKPRPQLKPIFDALVQDRERLIFSCGSGLTACVLALAADLLGYSKLSVYDGSWSEWGADERYPVVS